MQNLFLKTFSKIVKEYKGEEKDKKKHKDKKIYIKE